MKNIVYAIPLVMALVGMLGQHAFATNESSYKWGYREAQVDYSDCLAPDNGCGTATTGCFSPISTSVGDGTVHYHEIIHYDIMTNKTACIDGYVNGWNHVCDPVKAKDNGVNCPTTFQQEVRRVGY